MAMDNSIVLNTDIYTGTIAPYDNLADLIIDATGDPIDAFAYLRDLEAWYPRFYKWYHEVVLADLRNNVNGRCMLFAFSNVLEDGEISKKLTGLAILKSTEKEKKICTIRVFSKYQGQGIGNALIERCIKYLKTKKPLITISEPNEKAFEPFINKYKWKLIQVLPDYYQLGVTEFVYNGKLLDDEEVIKYFTNHFKKLLNKSARSRAAYSKTCKSWK